MKKLKSILLIFCFVSFTFSFSNLTFAEINITPQAIPPEYYPGSLVVIKPGDVLITNNTSSYGVTGHAGIVIDAYGTVVSIRGSGYHPRTWGIDEWFAEYPNEKVVRYRGANATAAANWAANYVKNYRNAYYDISPLYYMDSTYCSKIVWQAYYYGANYELPTVYNPLFLTSICKPYDLPTAGTVVLTKGSW
ncbi:hypothetical protein LR69_02907 [Geobacillus sp. BCO2]|nr:hypothetical protein LR69_02907 [Geobacillus sp. BCO2]